MYKSNLSYKLIKTHVQELLGMGVIREEAIDKRKYIVLTENGKKFISELRKMKRFLDSFVL